MSIKVCGHCSKKNIHRKNKISPLGFAAHPHKNLWILLLGGGGGDMLLSGGSDNGFHFDLGYLIIQTGRSTQNL